MTYREAIKLGESILQKADITDAKNDAWLLLAMACKIDRTYYYVHMDEELTTEQTREYQSVLKKRAERIPLQYITGEQEFMGLTFHVNNNVLIPRQDTETLVEEALKIIEPGMKVLDMCTGSGCIIISIFLSGMADRAVAVDYSEKALSVAKQNASLNNADIEFIYSDLFENVSDDEIFDMIVSNPPYIETDEIETLSDEVRLFDPMMALDGDKDGLKFYRNITEQAAGYLKRGGWLMYEIGCSQAVAVSEIMHKNGFAEVTVIKDLSGLDRVVCGKLM